LTKFNSAEILTQKMILWSAKSKAFSQEKSKNLTPFSGPKINPLLCTQRNYLMITRLICMAFGLFMIASCAKPKGFDYLGFQNVKVLKWGIKETTVGMDVQFYNPNSGLQLKKAEVDVQINNKYL